MDGINNAGGGKARGGENYGGPQSPGAGNRMAGGASPQGPQGGGKSGLDAEGTDGIINMMNKQQQQGVGRAAPLPGGMPPPGGNRLAGR